MIGIEQPVVDFPQNQRRQHRDRLRFIKQRQQAIERAFQGGRHVADTSACTHSSMTRRRQAPLCDDLGEHADIQFQHQPDTGLVGTGNGHLRVGRQVQ
ncbi:hypothetical protein D3C71_1593390 [compost metagenome]